ncbi:hypothetical protein ABCS02_20845 [Microbacterium sp. X-17]|uniref:hypothetical protein n=1 Tax=Microbacterium sp. X-17 TaxID=3144404 RepID=UPI0031F49BEC
MTGGMPATGIVLPVEVLSSVWFTVLAQFVAVNTVLYVCLTILKILPAPRHRWRGGRSRRRETRSIHPDAPE